MSVRTAGKGSGRRASTGSDRKGEVEALQTRLGEAVEELRVSAQWRRFLAFVGSFHAYSFSNVLLILSQRPEATRVAGYRTWAGGGRQVRKGEKSIRILAPMSVRVTGDDESTGEEEATSSRRLVFRPVSVFDIAQTDPIEGAQDLTAGLGQELSGEDPDGIFERVTAYLNGIGWSVAREPLYGPSGFSTNDGSRRVVIAAGLPPAHAASVLLHEAAHVTLGHCDRPSEDYRTHRGAFEVAAESVAYVTAGLLGLDTAASSVSYVAGWVDGPDGATAIKETASAVVKAVHSIAEAIATPEAGAPR